MPQYPDEGKETLIIMCLSQYHSIHLLFWVNDKPYFLLTKNEKKDKNVFIISTPSCKITLFLTVFYVTYYVFTPQH